MRIGIVCPYDWSAPGGVKAHVHDLAEALLAAGHEVSVLAPSEIDEIDEPWVVNAGRPVSVPYNGSVARVNFGMVSAARVRRWVKDGAFDIVHVHEPASPTVSLLACWVSDGPVVGTWHSSQDKSRAMSAAARILQTAIEKISGRIAVSEKARETLVEHLGGDAVLIPNGVSCARFENATPLAGYPRTGPTALFLGRIDESRKGLPVLIDALPQIVEQYPDFELLVAGPGEADKITDDLPAELAHHVRFLGLVSEEDKISAFASADVYVAPNTGGESFGIVLLEAMAAGTPVVASDIEAFEKVLGDGRWGELFDNGNSADLATVINRLLADEPRRAELAVIGHERAMEFDWSKVARDVQRVYDSCARPGVTVNADYSGQFFGRMGSRGEQ